MNRFLLSLILLVVSACSSTTALSEKEQTYYQDMQSAYQALKPVAAMAGSGKFAKVRFEEQINQMLPTTQKALKPYKNDPEFQNRESYQMLFKAYENFVLAQNLWNQEKGMALVTKRLADGVEVYNKFPAAVKQETNPEPAK